MHDTSVSIERRNLEEARNAARGLPQYKGAPPKDWEEKRLQHLEAAEIRYAIAFEHRRERIALALFSNGHMTQVVNSPKQVEREIRVIEALLDRMGAE